MEWSRVRAWVTVVAGWLHGRLVRGGVAVIGSDGVVMVAGE